MQNAQWELAIMKGLQFYCKSIIFSFILFSLIPINTIAAIYEATSHTDSIIGSLHHSFINANSSCNLDKTDFATNGPAMTEIDDSGAASPAEGIYYAYYSIQPDASLPDMTCHILIDTFTPNSDGDSRILGTRAINFSGRVI